MNPAAVFAGFAILGLLAGTSAAQTAPPAGTVPAFVIQSDNGDNRLQLGGFVQFDGRFTVHDPQRSVTDTLLVRRLRSIAQGRVARYFDFYLNVDFAGGAVNVRDAYFDTAVSDAFRVRVGRGKVPFSYERQILVSSIMFVERGFTTGVAPDRDIGVQVLGDLAGNVVSYAASLTNGVVDGGSADLDANEAKDVAGRLVVRPWARTAAHSLSGLGFAAAGGTGTQASPLPSFQSSGRQTYFSYAGAAAEGRRTRLSPQVFYYKGPFGGYGEYVRSRGGVREGLASADVDHVAWQVAASWVVTGEAAGERNVRPRVNFDPPTHHFGALQLAVRYQAARVSRNAVTLGLAAPNASRTADAWTLGANWYLNPYVKWNINVERTVFDGDAEGPRPAENAILIRAHLGF